MSCPIDCASESKMSLIQPIELKLKSLLGFQRMPRYHPTKDCYRTTVDQNLQFVEAAGQIPYSLIRYTDSKAKLRSLVEIFELFLASPMVERMEERELQYLQNALFPKG